MTRQRSFTDQDVASFLEDTLGHLPRFDANADHPFANSWHDGSWVEEAEEALANDRDDFGHITTEDEEAFIAAVGEPADQRGYADGCIKKYRDRALEMALLKQIMAPHPDNPEDSLYSSPEALDALIVVTALLIYRVADDHGAALAALLREYQIILYDRIEKMEHTAEFHVEWDR